jgi:adenylate kinase
MRITLLGAPGSGKGTQAKLLAGQYKLLQIATGDLLREAVSAGTALGQEAREAMEAGHLVSDDLVLAIIRDRLARSDARNGFILDGFPRNLQQAIALDNLLAELAQPLQLALLIRVDVDALLQRLAGRETCTSCGQMYNVFTSPPKMDGQCDKCGGVLRHRADDNEETISNRLRIFESQTLPLVDYYREQGKLRIVQGVGDIGDVFKAVRKVVEEVRTAARKAARSATIKRAAARQKAQKVPSGAGTSASRKASARGATADRPAAKAVQAKTGTGKRHAAKATEVKAAPRKAGKAPAVKKTKPGRAPGKASAGEAATKRAGSGGPATTRKVQAKKPAVKKTAAAKTAPASKAAVRKRPAAKKTPARKPLAKSSTATRKVPARKPPVKKAAAARKAPARRNAASDVRPSSSRRSPGKREGSSRGGR